MQNEGHEVVRLFWDQACRTVYQVGFGEQFFVVLVASVVHAVGLWGSCGFFVALDRLGWCQQYKIPRNRKDMQATTPENIRLNKQAWYEQIVGTFVVVPVAVALLYPGLAYRGMLVCEGELPEWSTIVGHFLGMLLGCDALFYWTHRLLHANGWLYRNVHKQHHEFKATTVWASEYFGVIDMLMNILPGVIPAIVMNSHFMVLMLFTGVRQWQTVQSHAGFDLPFDILNRGVFSGGARRHDFHHSHNVGCYGDWMPFWDYIMGTDVQYQAYWKKTREPRKGKML
jgi:sterol desaturase/sphingolipid hydroxylase (fatty acid hydroxylase superfamily)